ncbi:MAG TPA: flagellar basal body L-ring protein FlgH [Candidatus Gastranaerophilales bacterium]|nr:flagellar basal body L-ring protein FlgH [Candidatus Gastranaerophilales bacterium]
MKKNILFKTLISISAFVLINNGANAESLFQAGVSQSVYPMQPKSLFSTVRAKTIGDVITVILAENSIMLTDLSLNVSASSEMEDKFTSVIDELFNSQKKGTRIDLPDLDGYGGSSKTKNTASAQRTISLNDTITVQVTQVLPNGNLVIQGKKVAINGGEKSQVIMSGILDPRFITTAGTVQSSNIANLQLAVVGNGTVSRHDSESLMNRIFGHLF